MKYNTLYIQYKTKHTLRNNTNIKIQYIQYDSIHALKYKFLNLGVLNIQ